MSWIQWQWVRYDNSSDSWCCAIIPFKTEKSEVFMLNKEVYNDYCSVVRQTIIFFWFPAVIIAAE